MQTMLMQLEVGLLHDPTQSWTEELEVDVSENETPLIACQRIISKYNKVEIARYGEEDAKRTLRKLISCRIVTKPEKGKDMGISGYVDKIRNLLDEAESDLSLDEYKDLLSEVQDTAETKFAELPDDEELEDEEDEEDEEG